MIARLTGVGAVVACALTAAVYPVASFLARGATEVWLYTPSDPAVVELNRGLFDLASVDVKTEAGRREVMRLYGNPTAEPIRVLFLDEARLVRPAEAPDLVLLPQDKEKGENVLQVQTVFFFAKLTTIGGAIAAGVLLGLWGVLKRRRGAGPAPAAA